MVSVEKERRSEFRVIDPLVIGDLLPRLPKTVASDWERYVSIVEEAFGEKRYRIDNEYSKPEGVAITLWEAPTGIPTPESQQLMQPTFEFIPGRGIIRYQNQGAYEVFRNVASVSFDGENLVILGRTKKGKKRVPCAFTLSTNFQAETVFLASGEEGNYASVTAA